MHSLYAPIIGCAQRLAVVHFTGDGSCNVAGLNRAAKGLHCVPSFCKHLNCYSKSRKCFSTASFHLCRAQEMFKCKPA